MPAEPPTGSPGLPDGFVEPAYGRRSLGDVVPAAARALGVPAGDVLGPGPTELDLPEAQAFVVFLIDGLGLRLLQRHANVAPYLASLMRDQAPATAGVPSTTSTSLTSLGTGLPPGGHGLLGFTTRVPGTERLLNALFWSKDIDPLEWQPRATAFDALSRAGVVVTVVNKREFRGSGLTVAAHRGGEYVGADRVGERIAAAVEASSRQPSLVYLYDGDLDWTGHRFGVDSEAWLQQLITIDGEAEQLREALPPSVRLVVVADHGMVDCAPERRIDIDEHPQLRDGLALLGGEARFRHLYARPGAQQDLRDTWAATLGPEAVVLTREEAAERGWFGDVDPRVALRIGDVVAAATGDFGMFSSADFAYEMTLVGLHGSLTEAEMLIPVLVD